MGGCPSEITTRLVLFAQCLSRPTDLSISLSHPQVVPEAPFNAFTTAVRSNSFEQLQRAVRELLADGFPAQQLITQVAMRIASLRYRAMGVRGNWINAIR